MRLNLLKAILSFLALSLPAVAQELLPPGFAGWTPAGTEKLSKEKVDALAGADAALLREFGVNAAERRSYRKNGGTLSVVVYRFGDSTAAYGAFTFLRADGMQAADFTEHSTANSGRALGVVGNLLMDASAPNVAPLKSELKALAEELKLRADAAPYPVLAQYLPERGLIRGSDRYVLGPVALERVLQTGRGDWIGFSNGAEVEAARYQMNGRPTTLVLASFPTPNAARQKLEGLRRWFNVDASEEKVAGRPVVYTQRRGSLLAIVVDATTAGQAEALLGGINYKTQVTWNEPSHLATDRPWGETVYNIFVGTGVFMMLTVVGGLAFAAFRLAIKRLLPGKVFDRAGSVEILQLGLGSKPIEGKDFY